MAEIEKANKKGKLPAAVIFLLFVIALVLLAYCIIQILNPVKPAAVPGTQKELKSLPVTIVIDAGHGGMDAGASGGSGVREDVLNLDVAKKLQSLLTDFGATVVMTRETEEAVASTKNEDMQERRKIIEDSGAAIVVSIHMNFFGDESACGPQVFFYETSEKGRALAAAIQTSLNEALTPEKPRTHLKADYFILRSGNAPAVIVECGFLSNAKEEALLKDEVYRKKAAVAIFEGIKAYFTGAEDSEAMLQ